MSTAVANPNPINQNALRLYYSQLMPVDQLYELFTATIFDLSALHTSTTREFSTQKNDRVQRYKHFGSADEFRACLCRDIPDKIDCGAICYSYPDVWFPKNSKNKVSIQQREFVLDIDLNDYNDMRNCCTDSNVCDKCWNLIRAAQKLTDKTLLEQYNCKQVLWVFSGRRGVHCWVFDKDYRFAAPSLRGAMLNQLGITQQMHLGHFLVHICDFRIYEHAKIVEPYFNKLIQSQCLLKTTEQIEKLKRNLHSKLQQIPSVASSTTWLELKQAILSVTDFNWQSIGVQDGTQLVCKLMVWFCAPRFDRNVTKSVSHLLKMPFCVHPKTGLICVPITQHQADVFNPLWAPSLMSVLQRAHQVVSEPNDQCIKQNFTYCRHLPTKKLEVEKQSLYSFICHLDRFVASIRESQKCEQTRLNDIMRERDRRSSFKLY